jgi:hypothetical protein
MEYLILTVLLTIMQTLPPIARKAPNSAASTSQKVPNKTSDNRTPATSTKPVIDANTAPNHETRGNGQATDNAQNPIVVGKLPSVSIAKDWLDWGGWIFSIFLVVVGALQVWVLIRQANIMGKHAKHLENLAMAAGNNAKAALLNAQAVANAERPWLIVDIGQDDTSMGTHLLRVWNRGKTPAELSDGRFGLGIHAPTGFVPDESVMGPFIVPIQTLTLSGEYFKIDTFHPHNFLIEKRTNPTDLLYVYGKIVYWDTFTDRSQKDAEPCITRWCLTYDPARHIWYRTANGYSKNT